MGQIAFALNKRPQGTLPSDIEKNPKGNHVKCQAIMLRSGKQLEGQKTENLATKEVETDSENKVVEDRQGEEKQVEKSKIVKEPVVYPPPPFQQRVQNRNWISNLLNF